jgi:hypothetical protein
MATMMPGANPENESKKRASGLWKSIVIEVYRRLKPRFEDHNEHRYQK